MHRHRIDVIVLLLSWFFFSWRHGIFVVTKQGCPESIFSRVRCSLCSPLIAELLSAAFSRHLPPFWMIKCSYFPSQEFCAATESMTLELCTLGCISGSDFYWSEKLAKSLICSNPYFPHLKKRNKHLASSKYCWVDLLRWCILSAPCRAWHTALLNKCKQMSSCLGDHSLYLWRCSDSESVFTDILLFRGLPYECPVLGWGLLKAEWKDQSTQRRLSSQLFPWAVLVCGPWHQSTSWKFEQIPECISLRHSLSTLSPKPSWQGSRSCQWLLRYLSLKAS